MYKVKRYLFLPSNSLLNQFIKYFLVAGIAFAVDYTLLYIFTEFLQVYYLVSAIVSFAVGIVISYNLSVQWVFNTRNLDNRMQEFLVFLFIGIIGLVLNIVIIYMFTSFIHFHYMFSKIISTAFVYFWNFGARKLILFK